MEEFFAGSSTIVQTELPIYGAERLGVYVRGTAGGSDYINYQITDHLGNVRGVIKRIPGNPIAAMITFADYYPFGEKLPTRDNITGNYRYAYQGQELDGETGMEAFQLRLWDGRIGRWLNPDPKGQYDSPYLGMGNNPVNRIDPDGGTDGGPGDPEIPAILSGNPNQPTPVYGPQPENLPVHNLAPITISATVCKGPRVTSAGAVVIGAGTFEGTTATAGATISGTTFLASIVAVLPLLFTGDTDTHARDKDKEDDYAAMRVWNCYLF